MIIYSQEREVLKMMSWYENPEIHDEDYEEMTELLALLAEKDPEA